MPSDPDAEELRVLADYFEAAVESQSSADFCRRVADRLEAHDAELLRDAERVRDHCASIMKDGDLLRTVDVKALLGEREES